MKIKIYICFRVEEIFYAWIFYWPFSGWDSFHEARTTSRTTATEITREINEWPKQVPNSPKCSSEFPVEVKRLYDPLYVFSLSELFFHVKCIFSGFRTILIIPRIRISAASFDLPSNGKIGCAVNDAIYRAPCKSRKKTRRKRKQKLKRKMEKRANEVWASHWRKLTLLKNWIAFILFSSIFDSVSFFLAFFPLGEELRVSLVTFVRYFSSIYNQTIQCKQLFGIVTFSFNRICVAFSVYLFSWRRFMCLHKLFALILCHCLSRKFISIFDINSIRTNWRKKMCNLFRVFFPSASLLFFDFSKWICCNRSGHQKWSIKSNENSKERTLSLLVKCIVIAVVVNDGLKIGYPTQCPHIR